MTIESSLRHVFDRLTEWSEFPKYSLERRVDIFVTPFLERFIGRQLGGTARFVAPEFPLAADLKGELRPGERPPTARTVNVDYLLRLEREAPGQAAWVFVELKTDPLSFSPEQLELYRRARARGMKDLLDDLEFVKEATASHHAPKYARLLSAVRDAGTPGAPIEIVYLSPPLPEFTPGPCEHLLTLSVFADQGPEEVDPDHRELWPLVQKLLRGVEVAAASRSRKEHRATP